MTVLEVKSFAQIEEARIEFGDLTVLVGPQATGKSLLLQWLKVALDAGEIVFALKEAGHDVRTAGNLLDLTFGEGMSAAWTSGKTSVRLNGRAVTPGSWTRGGEKRQEGSVFFIPAHRALLLAEGWPAPFLKLNADVPVVADIRGYGMMAAIELHPDAAPGRRGHEFQKRLFDNGLHLKTTGDAAIVAPPLVATDSHIDEIAAILRRTLRQI